ncbi:flagellar M-ring protein FliF [Roseateles sp. YR242]|uniref:flagellar basal-body MS-ring/collar protein FliF n=1 Tax=Roseateles sp. YR242 TaxID=1855305 RepID=UPI0008D3BA35|nr:flagellar basal-body MS-ring/collar protein FliF [Roseateles sp. YR242]SEL45921.1 flagellar M-ring protein FliF [Roseateles sp. YR242]
MDNALSSPAAGLPEVKNTTPTSFPARLAAMPAKSKMMLGGGVAALLAVIVAMSLMTSKGDFRPLFSGLSDKDGGAVIAQLAQMNVPYRNEAGGTIMVPANQVYDLRMKLASQGLPKGGIVGFELMDKQSIGQTQFNERLNFQRGLEGELVRTITAMSDVADARVHLAMPQQNGFFREQQKPSASVMLTLRGGRTLDRNQIAGIVHLVSSSVPELNPKAVSVLDSTGALLSNNTDNNNGTGLDSQQLLYKQQVENNLNKRIAELLEPVVGRENLRSTVTADVDFSQVESTAEEFKPNQGPNTQSSVRRMNSEEQTGSSPGTPTGVPGATTNQVPPQSTAPINGQAQQLQPAGSTGGSQNVRRVNGTEFEVDRTVRVTRNAIGQVRRLNAAVVVNQKTVTDPKGKTTSQPLSEEELQKLDGLVKEALGFSQDRGDSVKVISAPFVTEKLEPNDVPLWRQPWLRDIARDAAIPAALVLVALIAVFGMVRPALKAAFPPPPEKEAAPSITELSEIENEQLALAGGRAGGAGGAGAGAAGGLPALEAPISNDKLMRARQLAKENPVAVANIMRAWVNGEELETAKR